MKYRIMLITATLVSSISFGATTAHFTLDCRAEPRVAAVLERISFDPGWESSDSWAVATVCINGVIAKNADEAGTFDWTPTQGGTYRFTHDVSVLGVHAGRTLTATFVVNTVTPSTPPNDWIDKYYPGTVDHEAAVQRTAANGLNTVAQTYVAGLDPTNETSRFSAAVSISNDMVYVRWTPDLNEDGIARIYKVFGRKDLDTGDWRTPVQPWHRFFKVEVSVPTGAADETTAVSGEGYTLSSGGGVQLWENGPYWAECNVGATKPEESGYYFWWGDTVGYVRSGGTWNSTDSRYEDVTWVSSAGISQNDSPFKTEVPTYNKGRSTLQSEGYVDSSGNLVPAYDAATAHLGAPWRLPTYAEILKLENCPWTGITTNGVYGWRIGGVGTCAANSIFIPAAGVGRYSDLKDPGLYVGFWSSTVSDSTHAWFYCFWHRDSEPAFNNNIQKYWGFSVRPVHDP